MVAQPRISRMGARQIRSRALDALRNIGLLGALWVFYSTVRSLAGNDLAAALAHSTRVRTLQDALYLPNEAVVQAMFLDHTSIIRAANLYYVSAHFPITVLFLCWAWFRQDSQYTRIRNSLVVATGAGLLIHLAYPLAPPRKLPDFIDTGLAFGPSPYALGGVTEAANQLAAMPSLHVGWALLVAMGFIRMSTHPLRFVAFLHPMVTTFVVVLTANHYWIDVIAAILLVVVAWLAFVGPAAQQQTTRKTPTCPDLPTNSPGKVANDQVINLAPAVVDEDSCQTVS